MSLTPNNITIIVPARLDSTRLPQKLLREIAGVPMLVRVMQQATKTAWPVVAAVDAPVLAAAVTAAGFSAVLTAEHSSGTSRLAQAAQLLALNDDDIVVNVQGDEPFIEPSVILAVAAQLQATPACVCATACRPARDKQEYHDPAAVKVVCNKDGIANYFSRAPIPFARADTMPSDVYIHIGIYAYRVADLHRYTQLPPAPTEEIEKLEQLRLLWHGDKVAVAKVDSNSFGIDTEEDLQRAQRIVADDSQQ